MTTSTLPNLTVYRVRFLEDDVHDGSVPQEAYDDAQKDVYEVDPPDDVVEEIVRFIEREGLTFEGAEWAHNPDGSYISNYATGERTEVTGHVRNVTDEQRNAIVERCSR